MKTAEPKIIYLQIGDDADITELKDYEFETNAITWCWERIHSNDIKYISKQSIIGLIDEMIKKNLENENWAMRPDNWQKFVGYEKALKELKQKIESL